MPDRAQQTQYFQPSLNNAFGDPSRRETSEMTSSLTCAKLRLREVREPEERAVLEHLGDGL